MKYCQHCGEQLSDDATFCGKCGQRCDGENTQTNFNPNGFGPNQYNQVNQYQNDPDANKSLRGTGIGVVFGLLLGLIGLILCLIMGDKKCKKACIITFGVSVGVSILVTIILTVVAATMEPIAFVFL